MEQHVFILLKRPGEISQLDIPRNRIPLYLHRPSCSRLFLRPGSLTANSGKSSSPAEDWRN